MKTSGLLLLDSLNYVVFGFIFDRLGPVEVFAHGVSQNVSFDGPVDATFNQHQVLLLVGDVWSHEFKGFPFAVYWLRLVNSGRVLEVLALKVVTRPALSETDGTQICLVVRFLLDDLLAERVVTPNRIDVTADVLIARFHQVVVLGRFVNFIFAARRMVVLLVFGALKLVLNQVCAGIALLVV